MSDAPDVPGHPNWFKYDFPLTNNRPVPSKADYSQENVAPLIEGFAGVLGYGPTELKFVYENNTPDDRDDDIEVTHPGDKSYSVDPCSLEPSSAMRRYEQFAKRSALLKLFQDNSPANIIYFQPLCSGSPG
jgi:hypothetical protein